MTSPTTDDLTLAKGAANVSGTMAIGTAFVTVMSNHRIDFCSDRF